MKKSDLISAIAATGVSKAQADAAVDAIVALADSRLKSGDDFQIPGLVKITAKEQAARTARNPATGESIAVPAKTVFKAKSLIKN